MVNGRLERREEAIDLALGYLLNCVKAGKQQTWTPKRIDLAFGVPVGCGMKHAKSMFKRLKGSRRLTRGERQAGPPRRSDRGRLGAAIACAVRRSEKLLHSFKGFKRFKGFKGFKEGF